VNHKKKDVPACSGTSFFTLWRITISSGFQSAFDRLHRSQVSEQVKVSEQHPNRAAQAIGERPLSGHILPQAYHAGL